MQAVGLLVKAPNAKPPIQSPWLASIIAEPSLSARHSRAAMALRDAVPVDRKRGF